MAQGLRRAPLEPRGAPHYGTGPRQGPTRAQSPRRPVEPRGEPHWGPGPPQGATRAQGRAPPGPRARCAREITDLRANEARHGLVCRRLLEKKYETLVLSLIRVFPDTTSN